MDRLGGIVKTGAATDVATTGTTICLTTTGATICLATAGAVLICPVEAGFKEGIPNATLTRTGI